MMKMNTLNKEAESTPERNIIVSPSHKLMMSNRYDKKIELTKVVHKTKKLKNRKQKSIDSIISDLHSGQAQTLNIRAAEIYN